MTPLLRLYSIILFSWAIPLPVAFCHEGHTGPHKKKETLTTRTGAKAIPPTKEEDVFHFVVYGDRTGGVPEGLKILEQAVVDTNLLDPDLVMTVGDLIQGYNETPQWLAQMKRYQAIMGELAMPWFPVAGNHDVYWRGKGKAPQGQHDSNYEEHFGPLWYSFRHKNAGFIVLYSDEGDPVTNRKAFNDGKLQTMSDQQLAFLDKALASLADVDHVFCILHHPRWIGGGYAGGNWETVHNKLVAAGNVTAVFAGHIHHMRFDGPKDGISYYTLATTGGGLGADIPDAGFLHHLNLVTVRKERISVSSLPIGAVADPTQFTAEFLEQIALARSIRGVQQSEQAVLQLDGSLSAELKFAIKNPCSRPIQITASLDGQSGARGWRSTLDHQHFEIPPGEQFEFEFDLARSPSSLPTSLPALELQVEYLAEKSRIRLPTVSSLIGMQPAGVPADYFTSATPHCLLVRRDDSALHIASSEIQLPDGPFTLEAWVRPSQLTGFRGIIAKTESSEYAFFCDEGVPKFDVHLGGRYVSASATEKLSLDKWTHLAGVFDGESVNLYVDGKRAGSTAGSGRRRTNQLPLFIGADPNSAGVPSRGMRGKIDEVRLSKRAVYSQDFTPARRFEPDPDAVLLLHMDRTIGPFVLDHSPAAAEALTGRTSKLVPVDE